MKCDDFLTLLPKVPDELPADFADAFDQHIKECPDCKLQWEQHQQMLSMLQMLDDDLEVPVDFKKRWTSAVYAKEKSKQGTKKAIFSRMIGLAATVVILLGTALMREGLIFQQKENAASEPLMLSRAMQYDETAPELIVFEENSDDAIMFPQAESSEEPPQAASIAMFSLDEESASEASEDAHSDAPPVALPEAMSGGGSQHEDETVLPMKLYSATLQMDASEFDQALQTIEETVARFDGTTEFRSESIDTFQNNARFASITIRVSADLLSAITDELLGAGAVTLRQNAAEDVSAHYLEIRNQIETLKAREASLKQLIKNADSAADAIEMDLKIGEIQDSINMLTAQKNDYESREAQAVLHVTVMESKQESAIKTPLLGRIKEAFMDSVRAVPGFLADLLIFIGYIAPYAVCGAVVLLLIVIFRKIFTQ